MPTVSVKLDSQSKYTIEFDAEYSPDEFIKTARRHIRFVNEIASGQQRLNQSESTAAQVPEQDKEAPRKKISRERPDPCSPDFGPRSPGGRGLEPAKAAAPPRRKIFRAGLLFIAFLLTLACSIGAICLWQSVSDKAPAASFKATISTGPAPLEKTDRDRGPDAEAPAAPVPAQKPNASPLPKLNKIGIYALEPAWLRIAEDNNPAYETMLQPGDKLEREASRFTVKIGNIKGVRVAFNNELVELHDITPIRRRGNVMVLKLPGE